MLSGFVVLHRSRYTYNETTDHHGDDRRRHRRSRHDSPSLPSGFSPFFFFFLATDSGAPSRTTLVPAVSFPPSASSSYSAHWRSNRRSSHQAICKPLTTLTKSRSRNVLCLVINKLISRMAVAFNITARELVRNQSQSTRKLICIFFF